MQKLLHAEELARYAGVHKSTVLLAIRRGELPASRTVGRSVRIAVDEACAYLKSRGCMLPPELAAAQEPLALGVLTASTEVLALVLSVVPAGVALVGSADLYTSLVDVGARAPRVLILDLDLAFLNPIPLLRTVRAMPDLRAAKIAGVALRDDVFSAALGAGADATFLKVQHDRLRQWLETALAALRNAATTT